jgi:hypothetical protein
MGEAWDRMSRRKRFPALGWVRSVEVTRSLDGTAHPHYHCLLAVPASYFGRDYLKQADWTELWKQALRVNYAPIVDVRSVKAKFQVNPTDDAQRAIFQAICETLKYSVKESDLTADAAWLAELTDQLHKTRAIATGGILKDYLIEEDEKKDDLTHVEEGNEETASEDDLRFWFGWREMVKRYAKE